MTARRLDQIMRHRNWCSGDGPLERRRNGNAGWKEECTECGAYAAARPFWARGIDGTRGSRVVLPMLNETPTTRTATDVGMKVWRFNHDTGQFETQGE